MSNATEINSDSVTPETAAYLIFALADGMYATPLLSVREVVEFKSPKPMPNAHPSFLGVINIRGEIVGVLDLSLRLGGKPISHNRPSLLVVGSQDGAIAALVDEVHSVANFAPSQIDPTSKFDTGTGTCLGVARHDNFLVTLLNLESLVACSEVALLKKQSA